MTTTIDTTTLAAQSAPSTESAAVAEIPPPSVRTTFVDVVFDRLTAVAVRGLDLTRAALERGSRALADAALSVGQLSGELTKP